MFRTEFTCQSDTTLHQPFQQAHSENEQPECLLQMEMQNEKVFSVVIHLHLHPGQAADRRRTISIKFNLTPTSIAVGSGDVNSYLWERTSNGSACAVEDFHVTFELLQAKGCPTGLSDILFDHIGLAFLVINYLAKCLGFLR